MPLVRCPDCAREVSDVAPACPGCGRPLAWQRPPQWAVQPIAAPPGSGSNVVLSGVRILGALTMIAGCGVATLGCVLGGGLFAVIAGGALAFVGLFMAMVNRVK